MDALNRDTGGSFGDYHAERVIVQTMTHTLRPKSGNRALVVAEVLQYLLDNLSFDTPGGRVISAEAVTMIIDGLGNVPEFAGGHREMPNSLKTEGIDSKVLRVLGGTNPPSTIEGILDRLREDDVVHKHEVTRAVWKLVEEGKVVVESGRIKIAKELYSSSEAMQ